MKKISKIKRFLIIALIFLFSINSFAAIVSDNDGSAFVTKAEFDALKNSFNKQIEDYNLSIDGKIDGAIASYLAGISLTKNAYVPVKSTAREVYCMKYKTDIEEKDMKYTYVTPYVHLSWITFMYRTASDSMYAIKFNFLPNDKKKTGTRLYISDVVDKQGNFDGCAAWYGYGTGVSETQNWSSTNTNITDGMWGLHGNTLEKGWKGMGMNHVKPTQNTILNGKSWQAGTVSYVIWGSAINKWDVGSSSGIFNIYVDNFQSDYTDLTNTNLIIWQPETYYCFTEKDVLRDYEFDNVAANIPKNGKTYVEELWMSVSAKNDEDWMNDGKNDFKDIFKTIDYSNNCSAWNQSQWVLFGQKSGEDLDVDIRSWVQYNHDDYGKSTGRQPYTVQGFPWYSINNWKQLYCKVNDWAATNVDASEYNSIIDTPVGDKHLSLNGGWPIIEVEKEHTYTYKVSFKESCNHVVFGKIVPFTTSNPTTESNLIEWEGKTPTTWNSKTVAYAESGETLELTFTAQNKGILYLKWADDDPVTHTPTGGGTIQLNSEILDIYAG